jgi:hypothetical protein
MHFFVPQRSCTFSAVVTNSKMMQTHAISNNMYAIDARGVDVVVAGFRLCTA